MRTGSGNSGTGRMAEPPDAAPEIYAAENGGGKPRLRGGGTLSVAARRGERETEKDKNIPCRHLFDSRRRLWYNRKQCAGKKAGCGKSRGRRTEGRRFTASRPLLSAVKEKFLFIKVKAAVCCPLCGRFPSGMAFRIFAGVAQPVEQLICNQQVGGSNPSTSSTPPQTEYRLRRFFF